MITRLFSADSDQGIRVCTMFLAPGELSIIPGIGGEDLNRAVRTVYDTFIRE